MTRQMLATCCALTVGVGVIGSWLLSRFDVARINARFDALESRLDKLHTDSIRIDRGTSAPFPTAYIQK